MVQTTSLENFILKGTSISEDELRSILTMTNSKGETLRNSLEFKQYTSAEDALGDLCKQLNVEFMKEIPYNDIAVDLVRNIPINYAKTHQVIPFREETHRVLVLVS